MCLQKFFSGGTGGNGAGKGKPPSLPPLPLEPAILIPFFPLLLLGIFDDTTGEPGGINGGAGTGGGVEHMLTQFGTGLLDAEEGE